MARISVPAEAFLAAAHEAAYGVLTAGVFAAEVLRALVNVHAVGFFILKADLTRAHVAACV